MANSILSNKLLSIFALLLTKSISYKLVKGAIAPKKGDITILRLNIVIKYTKIRLKGLENI